ncbi:MAG: bacteriohemerythrin [Holophagales bacterium]|nr:bacteriohemerythrin [Holophagales bacterium]
MPWNESLSVKVSRFDNEHKKLIGLVDELIEAMSQGKGRDILSETLRELLNYTVIHFKNEEQAMQKYGYPAYEFHKAQHDEFVNKAMELKEGHENGHTAISVTVLHFLNTWVANHIKKTDFEYAAFFKEKGLK